MVGPRNITATGPGAGIVDIILKRAAARREKDALDLLSATNRGTGGIVATPQPIADESSGPSFQEFLTPDQQGRYKQYLGVIQGSVLDELDDDAAFDMLGRPSDDQTGYMESLRADPTNFIAGQSVSVRERYDGFLLRAAPFGGSLDVEIPEAMGTMLIDVMERLAAASNPEASGVITPGKRRQPRLDNPFIHLFDIFSLGAGEIKDQLLNAMKFGVNALDETRSELWKFIFGEPNAPDPLRNSADRVGSPAPFDNIEDLFNWVRHEGIGTIFFNLWREDFQEPQARNTFASFHTISALLGGDRTFTNKYNQNREGGMGNYDAIQDAFDETPKPQWIEDWGPDLFDPTNFFLGFGAITIAKKVPAFGKIAAGLAQRGAVRGVEFSKIIRESDLIQASILRREPIPFSEKLLGKKSMELAKDLINPKAGTVDPESIVALERVQAKIAGWKSRNSTHARAELDDLNKRGISTDDADDALREYRDTVRKDFDDAEDFASTREETWDTFIEALDSLEIEALGASAKLLPTLSKPGAFEQQFLGRKTFFRDEMPQGEGVHSLHAYDIERGRHRFPGVTRAAKLLDPGAVETDPVMAIYRAHGALRDEGETMKTFGSHVLNLFKDFVPTNSDGIMSNIRLVRGVNAARKADKKPPLMGHIGEYLSTFPDELEATWRGMDDGAMTLYTMARKLMKELEDLKLSEGVLTKEELVTDVAYWPIQFMNKTVWDDLKVSLRTFSPAEVGRKQRFQFPRAAESILDDIKNGAELNHDVIAVWESHVNQVIRAVSDVRLSKSFEDMGLLVNVKQAQQLQKSLKAIRTRVNTLMSDTSTSKAKQAAARYIEKNAPEDIAGLVRGATSADDLDAVRATLGGNIATQISRIRQGKAGTPLEKGGPVIGKMTPVDEKIATSILNHLEQDSILRASKLGKIKDFSDFVRLVSTTLDFSAPFIQGLPLLFSRPADWAKAVSRHYEAFFDPQARSRFMVTNIGEVRQMAQEGVLFGSTEFTEAISQPFLTGKFRASTRAGKPLEVLSKLSAKTIRPALTPFQRAFDTFGDTARFYAFRSLRPLAKTPDEAKALVDFVNHVTGNFSTARLGVMPTQRAWESLLLFSPRYNRAGLALVKDIFQGDFGASLRTLAKGDLQPAARAIGLQAGGDMSRGFLARRAFSQFLLWGLTSYVGIAKMLGQDLKLDPRPVSAGGDGAAFLTWEVRGARFGYGSWWLSFARLLGSIYGQTVSDPDGFLSWQNVRETPGEIGHDFLRFFRGKTAPLLGAGIDILLGSTFINEEVGRGDVESVVTTIAKYEATRLLPLASQDFFEGNPDRSVWDRIIALGPGLAGLRVFPTSIFEQIEVRGQEVITGFLEEQGLEDASEDEWRSGALDLPLAMQGSLGLDKMYDRDPAMQRLEEIRKADRMGRGDALSQKTMSYFDALRANEAAFDEQRNAVTAAFRKDQNSQNWGDALATIAAQQRAAFKTIQGSAEFEEVIEMLNEKSEDRLKKSLEEGDLFVGDLAYALYVRDVLMLDDVPVADGGFQKPNLEPDWDAREAKLAEIVEFAANLDDERDPDEITRYLDLKRAYRRPDEIALDPLLDMKRKFRDEFEPYWEIPERLFGDDPDWALIEELLAGPNFNRKQELEQKINQGHRVLGGRTRMQRIRRQIGLEREQFRRNHPDLDAKYAVLFGATPLPGAHQEWLDLLEEIRQQNPNS